MGISSIGATDRQFAIPAARSSRYVALDGMRGAAAFMVVLFHLGQAYHSTYLSGGYLAVDLFFVLSGFVIGTRYQIKLREGLSFGRFMEARLIRLYPSYLVGLLLATVVTCIYTSVGTAGSLSVRQIVSNFIPNLFFLPGPIGPILYRLNPPVWSLLFELIANALFAVVGYRLKTKQISLIAAFALASLVALTLIVRGNGTDFGFEQDWTSFFGGLSRVLWSFSIGIVLARLPHVDRRQSWLAIVLLVMIAGYFFLPKFGELQTLRDLCFVVVISPALAYIGTRVEPPAIVRRWFAAAGDISYPLYATHHPILGIVLFAGLRLHLPHKLITPSFMALAISVAWLVTYFIDTPARDRLSRLLGLLRSSPVQAN